MYPPITSDQKGNGAKTPVDWARIWFSKLAKFHKVQDPASWAFTRDQVIVFLKSKVKAGVPAWKRVLIVQALIVYRNKFLKSPEPKLEDIRAQLQVRAASEKQQSEKLSTIDVVGKIGVVTGPPILRSRGPLPILHVS